MFTLHSFRPRLRYCKGLTGCVKVRAQMRAQIQPCGFFLGGSMKKLVAMIFFAMFAGNAMAQAGGASAGAGAGGGAAAGAAAGTIATVAVAVVGLAAASANNSTTTNH